MGRIPRLGSAGVLVSPQPSRSCFVTKVIVGVIRMSCESLDTLRLELRLLGHLQQLL